MPRNYLLYTNTHTYSILYNTVIGNPCEPNPCEHGGTCTNDNGNPMCDCTDKWEGSTCQTEIGKC